MAEMRGGKGLPLGSKSCQKMAKMKKRGGAVAISSELPENGRNEGRGRADVSCRKLRENDRNGMKGRGCRELP